MFKYPSIIFLAISLVFSAFFSVSLSAEAQFRDCKAGLMPFTLYSKGAIRTYYHENSSIQGISYFDAEGVKYATQEYTYNNQQLIHSRRLTQQLARCFSHSSTFSYTYNTTRQLLESLQRYGKGAGCKTTYSYAKFGLAKASVYDCYFYCLDLLDQLIEYNYNSSGQLISRHFFSPNEELLLSQEWTYDSQERVICFATYDQEHNLIWATEYSFGQIDKEGQQGPNIETYIGPNRDILGYLHIYLCQDENLKDQPCYIYAYDKTGTLTTLTSFTYNLAGQLIKIFDLDRFCNLLGSVQLFYDTLSRPYQIEYEYSDMDLLTKRVLTYLQLPQNEI